jgi:ATP-dependent RNA helicase DDX49/DBP8
MIQELAIEPFGIHSLILTPTRELAFQIGEQCRILGTSIGLKISIIVGGMDMTRQDVELSQKPHIVIATPGRLRDHIQSHQLHFKRIQYLVMDEADRLLDPSFESDLEIILQELPKKRKTLLFSATMTKEIEELKFQHAEEPFVYSMENRFDTVSTLDHRYIFIPSTVSEAYLCWLILNEFQSKSIIIFCSRPKTCQVLQIILYQLGARSTCLHSHMSQQERLNSIAKFKGGIIPILISTDVGSRGLDIPQVEVVLNYQLPSDPADYIHRIGRTARAGRGGMSLSIVTERDIEIVETIEALTSIFF